MRIDARGLDHRELNQRIRAALEEGCGVVQVDRVNGQRYIGAGLRQKARIIVNGVPGNDLAAFMDGPEVVVNANAQDGAGNTMNSGKVVVHGDARDLIGYSMRGGKILVRGSVGYRVGIHMKSFKDQTPSLVIGGVARDFLGEYMAGGIVVVLGLWDADAGGAADHLRSARPLAGQLVGTGMHGGCIYLRGSVEDGNMGKEVKAFELTAEDRGVLLPLLREYSEAFGVELERIVRLDGGAPLQGFTKLIPVTHRPYGRLYAY